MGVRGRFRGWAFLFAAAGCAIAVGCILHWSVLHGAPNIVERVLWPGSYVLLLLFSPAPEPLWIELAILLIAVLANAVLYAAVGAAAYGVVGMRMQRSGSR